ncbi:hypothetical protein GLE_3244 [Lysobacter enzymogenes]|uniref:Uncharacterized protein n=1 Tax=Lysobacter enzymogenes TaxID=69 RepID=A0A0S2DJ89_LYSEN|nr:hypothetical protein GLE_3244 [Lysobacter enzymogenes]
MPGGPPPGFFIARRVGDSARANTAPPTVIPAQTEIHFAFAFAFAVGSDATPSQAHAPQPRRACAWMRTRAMGQDVPYGAAPRPVLDLVALDPKKQGLFFGYFLCGLRQRK